VTILLKGTINQEAITIVNTYVPNVSAPNFIKQTVLDLKAQISTNTIIMGDFNTTLSLQD
jgi:N-methylhydantoinase B/oxoprolinase/acetone carboxylase alpha subunit